MGGYFERQPRLDYSALDDNGIFLAKYYAGCVGACLLVFFARACFASRDAAGEVSLIRWSTKVIRALVVLLVLVQLPLLRRAFSRSDPGGKDVLFDGFPRPLALMLVSSAGFFVNRRLSARLIFLCAMAGSILPDTFSQVSLDAERRCRSARDASEAPTCRQDLSDLSDRQLGWLIDRDLASICLELWCVVLTAQIWTAVGCSTRRGHHRHRAKKLGTTRLHGHEKLPLWVRRREEDRLLEREEARARRQQQQQ